MKLASLKFFLAGLVFSGLLTCPAFAMHAHIRGTPLNRVADEVLQSLLSSPLGHTLPRLHYRVILLNDGMANAFSQSDGTVYVTSGLFPIFQGDRGVWAAVIGHELGHVLLAHPQNLPRFEEVLRQAYAKARSEGYDRGPSRWPDVHLGERDPKLNFSRDQEYQADFIGLMLIADAGYQPDYSLIMEQRLLYGLGDQPELLSVFSHHPGMESREQRTSESSQIAMDIFRSRWPDAGKSPGGNLPPYGTIGRWTFEKADGGKMLVFRVPFQVHRAANMEVRLAAFFLDHDLRVRSSNPQYRASDGSLILNSFQRGTGSESLQVTLQVPAGALATRDHKLEAVVFLMAGSRPLDASTLHIDLGAAGSGDERPHHAYPDTEVMSDE